MSWSLEVEEIKKMVEEMVLHDDLDDAKRLEEEDKVMSSQDETIKMEES